MQEAEEQLDFSILDNGLLADEYEDTMCPVRKIASRGITKPFINRTKRKQKRQAQRTARKAHA